MSTFAKNKKILGVGPTFNFLQTNAWIKLVSLTLYMCTSLSLRSDAWNNDSSKDRDQVMTLCKQFNQKKNRWSWRIAGISLQHIVFVLLTISFLFLYFFFIYMFTFFASLNLLTPKHFTLLTCLPKLRVNWRYLPQAFTQHVKLIKLELWKFVPLLILLK